MTAYEMRISDWSSDVCSSDLVDLRGSDDLRQLAVAVAVERKARDLRGNAVGQQPQFRFAVHLAHVVQRGCFGQAVKIGTCDLVNVGNRGMAHDRIVNMEAVLLGGDFGGLLPRIRVAANLPQEARRSEEHTSELQPLMRNSYAVFCLKK